MEPLFDNISDTTAKSYVDFMKKLETMIGDTCRILTEDDFEKIKEEAKGVAFIINGFTIKVGDVSNRVKSNYDIIKVDKELDEIKIDFFDYIVNFYSFLKMNLNYLRHKIYQHYYRFIEKNFYKKNY